jgi:hypothetical protein
MPDKPHIGGGYIYEMSDGGTPTPVWTAVAEVETVGNIGAQAQEVDATPLSATTRRYIAGIKDGEQFDITLFHVPDQVTQTTAGLGLALSGQAIHDYRIKKAGVSKMITFSAVCLGRTFQGFEPNGVVKSVFRMRISQNDPALVDFA